jgi:hypothetical protein
MYFEAQALRPDGSGRQLVGSEQMAGALNAGDVQAFPPAYPCVRTAVPALPLLTAAEFGRMFRFVALDQRT